MLFSVAGAKGAVSHQPRAFRRSGRLICQWLWLAVGGGDLTRTSRRGTGVATGRGGALYGTACMVMYCIVPVPVRVGQVSWPSLSPPSHPPSNAPAPPQHVSLQSSSTQKRAPPPTPPLFPLEKFFLPFSSRPCRVCNARAPRDSLCMVVRPTTADGRKDRDSARLGSATWQEACARGLQSSKGAPRPARA
ncbi:hypothetical protein F5148DRAFT_618010 [Russula earlei]|uniref:Uncharacterized protein n=1 Tax=Russula earlei TaxID=71964 RepID=A0ACC0UFI5_9AGAM|nr:hypothetical protein F5148DRAFT_618010 [Russula earlei]